jgi:two-component sensor histidine kinase
LYFSKSGKIVTVSTAGQANVALGDILITDQPTFKRASDTRLKSEISALNELAQELVRTPKAIMDRLVELSLNLCDAESGGISLYEATAGEPVFRWHALKGRVAPFTGQTVPLNFSPCGVVLDQQKPILIKQPELYYPYLAVEDASISEGLWVPIVGPDGVTVGSLWIMSHDPQHHFSQDDCDTLLRLAAFGALGLALNAVSIQKDDLLARQDLMLREINHRVSNSLQLANSMLRLQERRAKGDEAKQELRTAADRLVSIGLIHTRLYKTGDMNAINICAYLQDLCVDLRASGNGRFSLAALDVAVSAPETLALPPDMVTKLGLIVNELVTNSFKHATGSSRCQVGVAQLDGMLELCVSDDGPGLPEGFDPRAQNGLGMRMVLSLVDQMNGRLIAVPTARGARFVISLPHATGALPPA